MSLSEISFYLLALGVAASINSIAISEILIILGLLISIFFYIKERKLPFFHRAYLPLLLFILWSFLSSFFSKYPIESLHGLKKCWIFLILFFPPINCRKIKEGGINFFIKFLSISILISAVSAIYQFITYQNPIVERIKGLSDHQMTFSGTLSMGVVFLFIYLLERKERNVLYTISVVIGFVGILISLTRSYWIATFISVVVYFLIKRKFKWMISMSFLLLILFFFSPHYVKERVYHLFDKNEIGNRARIEMWDAGFKIIKEHPIFGLGPFEIEREGYKYLEKKDFPVGYFMHMHNDYIQIAAERGLPALLFFLLFLGAIFQNFFKFYRDGEQLLSAISISSIFSTVVLILGGFFEYNFWDSEILILFLFMVMLPFYLFGCVDRRRVNEIS